MKALKNKRVLHALLRRTPSRLLTNEPFGSSTSFLSYLKILMMTKLWPVPSLPACAGLSLEMTTSLDLDGIRRFALSPPSNFGNAGGNG